MTTVAVVAADGSAGTTDNQDSAALHVPTDILSVSERTEEKTNRKFQFVYSQIEEEKAL